MVEIAGEPVSDAQTHLGGREGVVVRPAARPAVRGACSSSRDREGLRGRGLAGKLACSTAWDRSRRGGHGKRARRRFRRGHTYHDPMDRDANQGVRTAQRVTWGRPQVSWWDPSETACVPRSSSAISSIRDYIGSTRQYASQGRFKCT